MTEQSNSYSFILENTISFLKAENINSESCNYETILIKDKENQLNIIDSQYSIKCIFKDNSLIKDSKLPTKLQLSKWSFDVLINKVDNDYTLALVVFINEYKETSCDSHVDESKIPENINNNKDIQDKIYKYVSQKLLTLKVIVII